MRLKKALDEKLMDVRIRDKHLMEGKVSRAQVDEFLAKLPDDTNNLGHTEGRETRPEITPPQL